jgi:Pex19 protein family
MVRREPPSRRRRAQDSYALPNTRLYAAPCPALCCFTPCFTLLCLAPRHRRPVQDIGAKYPEWLEANRGVLCAEDFARYSEQYVHIQRIVQLYEREPEDFQELVATLQKVWGLWVFRLGCRY